MPEKTVKSASRTLPLKVLEFHCADLPSPTRLDVPRSRGKWQLGELFAAIERLSGLEVSIYPPWASEATPSVDRLPTRYRRHMSDFCRAAKSTVDGKGCRGHDAVHVNRKAGELRRPFVQTCHAGVAEAVVPIVVQDRHAGTVFVGQAVTPGIEEAGFADVARRVGERVNDLDALRHGYDALPRWSEQELMGLAMLVDASIRGLGEKLGYELLDQEVRLHNAPAIRRAIDILRREQCWSITAAAMAQRVHLSEAYFSRLFRQTVGKAFSDYVTERRLTAAQNWLHQTDLPIAEIAHRCGYDRQSYFTRRFRKWFGETPSSYRRRTQRETT